MGPLAPTDTDPLPVAGGAVLTSLSLTGHLDGNVILGSMLGVIVVSLLRPVLARLTASAPPKQE